MEENGRLNALEDRRKSKIEAQVNGLGFAFIYLSFIESGYFIPTRNEKSMKQPLAEGW